ncbi:MAG: hypothetical protein RLZZ440_1957 [Planctomycetota bacterium]
MDSPFVGGVAARQVTWAEHGHVLTNAAVWSPDSRWLVYDIRSAEDGSVFDGRRIERVEVESGRVELLYESRHGACCGVVTASPTDDRLAFILGPEHPTADWTYAAARRQGVVVRASEPGVTQPLDARDLVAPFTPGALRGGSHVHVFSPDGRLVSFTYEDAVLEAPGPAGRQWNLRGVGVSVCDRPVRVPRGHDRNHDGSGFSVLVTALADEPQPGSDEISRACEEGWVGHDGYLRADGSRQRRALAFQGRVTTASGTAIDEVFIVDLPDDPAALERPGGGPLPGTPFTRPAPPAGVAQRRLTFTADRLHPGIQGPRHWLRSNPAGDRIGFLMRDEAGIVQLFTVSPLGGEPVQVTRNPWDIASSFTWTPDGRHVACVADGSVCLVDIAGGTTSRLTEPVRDATGPRPEACVVSPDGRRIAFVRSLPAAGGHRRHTQLFVVDLPPG